MKKGNPIRELYWAIKTKNYSPDFTLVEYWVWRMVRTRPALRNHFYQQSTTKYNIDINL